MLFQTPSLTQTELDVLSRVDKIRESLRYQLAQPGRWVGLLRSVSFGRAIRGSNSIEGYDVRLDDAVLTADADGPSDKEAEAWRAVVGYRDAMTYVLQLADDPHFEYDEALIRSLHFMMLKYDLDKSPGRWRPAPVHVTDERTQEIVYTGPEAYEVPDLMRSLVRELSADDPDVPVMIRAAMAHLNLVMIHPFRDGNGRMARCLQTLVLSREGVLEAPFVSIEEYLGTGSNTVDYYRVLAEVGGGVWQPERDGRPWIRFILTAHYRQAQTLAMRAHESEHRWEMIAREAETNGLPERSIPVLFNASLGFRIRNSTYQDVADVSTTVAGRDLRALVAAGLLAAIGERRGRYYRAAPRLVDINREVRRTRRLVEDPFEDALVPRTLGL
ncbi:MAG: Fic family protein [Chloroflexota bacterium]